MTQVIIFCQPNGRVAICIPAPDSGLTIEEVAEKDVPQGCEYEIIDESEIPKNSMFFDAWTYSMPISIDVPGAHEIQKNRWRRAREPILKRLDIEFMRALELGQPTGEITAKKETLRNVTQTALPGWESNDSVDTFSGKVEAVWPDCLNW